VGSQARAFNPTEWVLLPHPLTAFAP